MSDLRLRYLAPLGVWLAAAPAVSFVEGTPDPLPAAALGSIALLHALRAGALFAIGFATVTVFVRAAAGRLPSQLSTSGIGYGTEETLASEAALNKLQEQVDEQQAAHASAAARLDALEVKS